MSNRLLKLSERIRSEVVDLESELLAFADFLQEAAQES